MALIGYAKVSTAEQHLDLQRNALAKAERPGLAEALGHVRRGDTLVVWKLDRLGRSMAHLIETVRKLETKGVGFRSLTEGVDTASHSSVTQHPGIRHEPRRNQLPRRGSAQGNTQNEKSLYHQSFIDFRCYLEMALFEPRRLLRDRIAKTQGARKQPVCCLPPTFVTTASRRASAAGQAPKSTAWSLP